MLDIKDAPASVTALEPPKRWRNWARALTDTQTQCSLCGARPYFHAGQLMPSHCRTYPSKDVAETHAAEIMATWKYSIAAYLGAFPEGEKPKDDPHA